MWYDHQEISANSAFSTKLDPCVPHRDMMLLGMSSRRSLRWRFDSLAKYGWQSVYHFITLPSQIVYGIHLAYYIEKK